MDTIVNERKKNLGEKLYIAALIFGISGSLLFGTMFSWAAHSNYLIRIGMILCITKSLFIDRYTSKQFWMYVICIISAVLSFDMGRHDILLIIPFIFAAKNVDFRKIMKTYLITVLSLILIVNFLSLIGKIPNLVFFRDGKPRFSYGFTYPTMEAAHIFYFLLAYTVYKKFKLNWVEDIIIAFLGCFIISKGDARLDGYLTFVLLFIIIFRKLIFKLLSKLNSIIPVLLVLVIIVGYLFLAKNYNSMNPTEFGLNNLLSNRLYLTQQGLLRYPVNFFGNHVQMQGFGGYAGLAMAQTSWLAKNYFYIDNSFAQILLINGSILFVITVIIFAYCVWKNMKNKNYSFVIALIFLAVAGTIESFILQISFDIFALMILANTKYWEKD